jgi:hypothetical protein
MIEGLLALLCIQAVGFAYLATQAKKVNFICLIFLNALPALLGAL